MKRKKIMFVCTGNTCRSPMAEYLLRTKIKQRKIKWWDVISCGLNTQDGLEMSTNSKLALLEVGIDANGFSSSKLTQKKIESSTLVVTMTSSQKQVIEDCGNVICIKDICGFDIPDPYGSSLDVYEITRNALSEACDKLINNYILTYKE